MFLLQSTTCLRISFQKQQFLECALPYTLTYGCDHCPVDIFIYYQSTLYNLAQLLACLKEKKKKKKGIRPQISSKLLVKEYLETLERMVGAVPEYFVTAFPSVVSVVHSSRV